MKPLLLIRSLLVVLACLFLLSCRSPLELAAYKVSKGSVVTVNAAMSSFYDACLAGQVSPAQKAQVDAVYDRYSQSVLIASNSVWTYYAVKNAGGNPTNQLGAIVAGAMTAQGQLLSLIFELLPAERTANLQKGAK